MLKAVDTLSLRGLSLEAMPAEFGWNQPPHEAMWAGLTDLDLSNNRLFQTAEVFRALAAALGPHLRRLDVSGNALAGEVPESAGALTGLTKLQAADNQLTAVSEGAAEGWTKLKTLELGRNQVKALPAAARRWSELVTVDLRSNGLLALEDDSCSTWREVEVLKIGGNNLAALPAAALGSWPKLRALYATDNKLAELPRELGACAHLEVLHAGVNTIKDLPSELFGDNGPLEVRARVRGTAAAAGCGCGGLAPTNAPSCSWHVAWRGNRTSESWNCTATRSPRCPKTSVLVSLSLSNSASAATPSR